MFINVIYIAIATGYVKITYNKGKDTILIRILFLYISGKMTQKRYMKTKKYETEKHKKE